jgi:hypothetical protein
MCLKYEIKELHIGTYLFYKFIKVYKLLKN